MDLGAGTGKSTIPLLGRFAEVMAIEPDPLMVEKLRTSTRLVIYSKCFGRGLYPGTVER